MGKKGKKAQAGKPKKLRAKDINKSLDELVEKIEKELKGADPYAPLPPTEDCPICLLPQSRELENSAYKPCCGQSICVGCCRESSAFLEVQNSKRAAKNKPLLPHTCPLCRGLTPSEGEECTRRMMLRASKNDSIACLEIGMSYLLGDRFVPKDELKGIEYLIRAVELGSADACVNFAEIYGGNNEPIPLVPPDHARSVLFYRASAQRGNIVGCHNVGSYEHSSGNYDLAVYKWKIAAAVGCQRSMDVLQEIYMEDMPGKEFICKEDLDGTYRVCYDAQQALMSEEREKHFGDDYRNLKC